MDFDSLRCPVCTSATLRVVMTFPRNGKIVRRRACKRCDFRFYTAEEITDSMGDPLGPSVEEVHGHA